MFTQHPFVLYVPCMLRLDLVSKNKYQTCVDLSTQRKGSATKLDGESVTSAHVRMGLETGHETLLFTRGVRCSMGVRFSGEGPLNKPMLHEPCEDNSFESYEHALHGL